MYKDNLLDLNKFRKKNRLDKESGKEPQQMVAMGPTQENPLSSPKIKTTAPPKAVGSSTVAAAAPSIPVGPEAMQSTVNFSVERPIEPIDMTERRQKILSDERRRAKRTILTEFITAYIVIPQKGLQNVILYDISEQGLSFDLDIEFGVFKVQEELAMRVYLHHQTYFPFSVRVTNLRSIELEGVSRVGVRFMAGETNTLALQHFVNFIETVSLSLQSDSGDILVTNIKE